MKTPPQHRTTSRANSYPVSGSASAGSAGEKPTRKNHYLYQSKIDIAKEILGVKTETEALDGALDMLIYGEALARGTEAMLGEEYSDVLGIAQEVPAPR